MRSGQVASILAMGLVVSLTLVSMPANAGCSFLLGQPTGCVTAIYNQEKAFVLGKAASAQSWAGGFPGAAAACGDTPLGVPGAPSPPGVEPAVDYLGHAHADVATLQAGFAVEPFPAAGRFLGDFYFHTVEVVVFADDTAEATLLPLVPDVEDPALPGAPTAPDLNPAVADLGTFVADLGTDFQRTASEKADCARNLPAP